jgi:WXG100 family type VII secretion target
MTSPWGLTPADLAKAQTDSQTTAESIGDQLGALIRYVDELIAEWLGGASGTFAGTMLDFNTHATNLQQTLQDIATTLGANHSNVVETELNNVRLLTPSGGGVAKLTPPRF